jgi:hypothetical protein
VEAPGTPLRPFEGAQHQRARRPRSFAPPAALVAPAEAPVVAEIKETIGLAVVEGRDRTFRRMLMYADLLATSVALLFAVWLLGDDQLTPMSVLALPLVVGVSKLKGLYDRDELLIRKTTMDQAPAIFESATLYTLVVWLARRVPGRGWAWPRPGPVPLVRPLRDDRARAPRCSPACAAHHAGRARHLHR